MKKLTQNELLNEGLWNGIKRVTGGAARGADYLMGKLAPEAQQLYKGPIQGVKGLVNAVKGEPSFKTEPTSQQPQQPDPAIEAVKNGLIRQNYKLDSNRPITLSGKDPNTNKSVYLASIIDPTTHAPKAVYTDAQGNIM